MQARYDYGIREVSTGRVTDYPSLLAARASMREVDRQGLDVTRWEIVCRRVVLGEWVISGAG